MNVRYLSCLLLSLTALFSFAQPAHADHWSAIDALSVEIEQVAEVLECEVRDHFRGCGYRGELIALSRDLSRWAHRIHDDYCGPRRISGLERAADRIGERVHRLDKVLCRVEERAAYRGGPDTCRARRLVNRLESLHVRLDHGVAAVCRAARHVVPPATVCHRALHYRDIRHGSYGHWSHDHPADMGLNFSIGGFTFRLR